MNSFEYGSFDAIEIAVIPPSFFLLVRMLTLSQHTSFRVLIFKSAGINQLPFY